MDRSISIAILSREPVLLHGLRACFDGQADIHIAWSGPTHEQALDTLAHLSLDVAILDCPPNDTIAWEFAEDLRNNWRDNESNESPVSAPQGVVFTSSQSECNIRRALNASAAGYVLRNDAVEAIVHSVRCAVAGKSYYSSPIRQRLVYDLEDNRYVLSEYSGLSSLTHQQMLITRLIAMGDSVKSVATQLRLSPKTVDNHKCRIMQKLGVNDRVRLSRMAIREGLIQP